MLLNLKKGRLKLLILALLISLDACKHVETVKIDNFCLWAKELKLSNQEIVILEYYTKEKHPSKTDRLPNIIDHLYWYDEEYFNRCAGNVKLD